MSERCGLIYEYFQVSSRDCHWACSIVMNVWWISAWLELVGWGLWQQQFGAVSIDHLFLWHWMQNFSVIMTFGAPGPYIIQHSCKSINYVNDHWCEGLEHCLCVYTCISVCISSLIEILKRCLCFNERWCTDFSLNVRT